MSKVDETITPMHRVFAVLGTFAAGVAASVALWNAWSDRCGEACPSPNVVHMLVFLGLLPTVSTMTAVLLVSTAWPRRVKWLVGSVALLAAVVVGALVSRLPGA
jgi:hypothetical protein